VKCYFHADSNMYKRKAGTIIWYTAPPVFLAAVISGVCIWISYENLARSGLLIRAVITVCAVLFVFSVFARVLSELAETAARNDARYTYAEIGLYDVIISVYAGSYTMYGEKTVLRRLFVIPLSGLESVGADKKHKITVKGGKIREYAGNTRRLGYYFKNGVLKFKEPYYEENGFALITEAVIPARFGNPEKLIKRINAAKKNLKNF